MTARRARQPARSRKPVPAKKRAPAKKSTATARRTATAKQTPAKKRPATVKPATGTTARRRGRGRLRRAFTGDRVYVFVFVGVVAALVAMAVGPLQNYTAAADRVDGLTETRDVLREEVDRLEDRRERLQDPEEVELMARAHLGLVMPGELPYVVVTPESELDRVHPEGPEGADGDREDPAQNSPWYHRLSRWLGDLVP